MQSINRYLSLFFILSCGFLASCTGESDNYSYQYGMYYNGDNSPSKFMIRNYTKTRDGFEVEIKIGKENSYDTEGVEKYLVSNGQIDRIRIEDGSEVYKPYLTTRNSKCVETKYDDPMSQVLNVKYCYLEKTEIKIGNILYNNVHKFLRSSGSTHEVKSYVFFDHNFNLLAEEFISGYSDIYKIERIESSILNDQE